MTSYEKQMQWKKASAVKSKKDKEDRAAAESYSFTPVIYSNPSHSTQKESQERMTNEVKQVRPDKSSHSKSSDRRESTSRDERPPRQTRNIPDMDLYSPLRGAGSVSSHQNSEAGVSSAGYGSTYNDQFLTGRGYEVEQAEEDNRSLHSEDHRTGPPQNLVGRSNNQYSDRPISYENRRHSQGGSSSTRQKHRESGVSLHHSSRDNYNSSHLKDPTAGSPSSSSSLASSDGEEEGEADEPIIELLERERKQWREEREKLIQCIHLQQLELSQRSLAAHERATDIAKEFARAIECFEERLVSVEGTVQKEIMSIKTIAESLLHAASGNNINNNNNSNNISSSGYPGPSGTAAIKF